MNREAVRVDYGSDEGDSGTAEMGEILQFMRDLLRLDAPARTGQRFHDHENSEPFDRRRPLFIGRGFICLGAEPVKSRYRGSRD